MSQFISRHTVLTGLTIAAPTVLVGCDRLSASPSFRELVLSSGEWLSSRVHRLIGADELAREFDPSEMSPMFRTNGNTQPASPGYRRHQNEGFVNWRLTVGGLVATPRSYSLVDLKSNPARSQITLQQRVDQDQSEDLRASQTQSACTPRGDDHLVASMAQPTSGQCRLSRIGCDE